MQIKPLVETEYDACIRNYFNKEFPNSFTPTKRELLEILAEILVGTKETRFGPIPPPEHLVVVRDVIRQSIDNSIPIPILVPFGGIKGNKTSQLDIAEVSAIKRLVHLDESIKRYYPLGIQANIRVEDLGALWLYGEHYEQQIKEYSDDFIKLTAIVAEGRNVNAISEWAIMQDTAEYFRLSGTYASFLYKYLKHSERTKSLGEGESFEWLKANGWKGEISWEQRQYYYNTYRKLDPMLSEDGLRHQLARYFGGSKARYDMRGTAAPQTRIGKHIQISYVQPIPGVPQTMFNNTLYYRTLPFSEARSHMPAWRSKGYLKIDAFGKATAKITNYHDSTTLDALVPSSVLLGNEHLHVKVHTDYLLV